MGVPALCVNNCGFYGSMECKNLCSKCYADFLRREEELLLQILQNHSSGSSDEDETSMNMKLQPCEVGRGVYVSPSSTRDFSCGGNSSFPSSSCCSAKKTKRCRKCNKKLGVLGFACRCGFEFCGSHRYPEEHSCSGNLKAILLEKFSTKIRDEACKADKLPHRV